MTNLYITKTVVQLTLPQMKTILDIAKIPIKYLGPSLNRGSCVDHCGKLQSSQYLINYVLTGLFVRQICLLN